MASSQSQERLSPDPSYLDGRSQTYTIVVLSTGDPALMPWVNEVRAVLETWYPGQEGGTSTANLLLGKTNPAGRLPISWPVSADQTPFAGHPADRLNGSIP